MATINNPTEINNNTPNAGTEIEERIETLYQNDLSLNSELGTVKSRTEIQTGTGHAPAGTPVKMSWFEGTTDGSGICSISHGLGDNILSFQAWIQYSSGNWFALVANAEEDLRYNSTIIQFNIVNSAAYSRPARFLVFHK